MIGIITIILTLTGIIMSGLELRLEKCPDCIDGRLHRIEFSRGFDAIIVQCSQCERQYLRDGDF